MNKRTPLQPQRGFTLVELSIVLVIIGLIIGGVLTGQQIIQNARVTNAINSVQSYQAQFQTYAQNYGLMPGDDSSAPSRFPNSSLTKSDIGNGNGVIATSNADSITTPANEHLLVWAHMRAAGLIKNQVSKGSSAVQPPNPFNGIYSFQTGAFDGVFVTTVLCMNNVSSDAALAIDTRLDDGVINSGSIQSTSGLVSAAIADTGYQSGSTYTLCIRI